MLRPPLGTTPTLGGQPGAAVDMWAYPDRKDPRYRLDSRHDALRTKLADELIRITAEAGMGSASWPSALPRR
ncbi:hypothetical protein [Pseudonocardia acidicola]|uniref:Uncharacterized protein n=1 Tax=Pseudonocardia acidicola TaxID=2724939 RepID=A0ABX1S5K6_9PSEU|nr:hypothetical protein [Pseudonocardia acidicola]NMH96864.1 hypothetical protein [Pseudonocardia acidicola]